MYELSYANADNLWWLTEYGKDNELDERWWDTRWWQLKLYIWMGFEDTQTPFTMMTSAG